MENVVNMSLAASKTQIARQVAHWAMATSRLGNLDDLAAPNAWDGLEHYLSLAIRRSLSETIHQLQRDAVALCAALDAVHKAADLRKVRRQLVTFRRRYLRVELILDFYADAINTRTNPKIAALLRACDVLAYRGMAQILQQLGKPVPPVLTYLDKGLGASILKAGLRLWDGTTENPAAAIKVVRHNLFRPTALIHEAGHQVAHITGWNAELTSSLESGLADASEEVAGMWASWSTEIAADALAFVQTGYGAVAGLHDVLAGGSVYVFRYLPHDPHPISYIRVLLGREMCRQFFGSGPWDALAQAWMRQHSLDSASPNVRLLLQRSLPLLPKVVAITLSTPMRAFGGQPLVALIDPQHVKPATLFQLERQVGPALYTSQHWVRTEAVRLLALTGLRAATLPKRAAEVLQQQEEWMLRLGASVQTI